MHYLSFKRHQLTTSVNLNILEHSTCPAENMATAQVHDGPAERDMHPNIRMRSGGADGNTVFAEAPEKNMKMRALPGEQMEGGLGSDSGAAGR